MEVIGYDIKPCPESGIKFMTKRKSSPNPTTSASTPAAKMQSSAKKNSHWMKPTAYVINTSRGSNIDSQAL